MSINIYDSANQMEREIRELPEFIALQTAFKNMQANEEVYSTFKEFQLLQQSLQMKQMTGEEFADEEIAKAKELTEKMQGYDLVTEMMVKEQAFSTILEDIQKIITKPVQELYAGE